MLAQAEPPTIQTRFPALVLNADYMPLSLAPISTWDFGRTLRNVLKGRVDVVATYDSVVRSPRLAYEVPSVVALKRYVKARHTAPFTRYNVFLRDRFRCQYCARAFSTSDLTFDHVTPRSRGGASNWSNIVSACVPCNMKKGNRTDMRPIAAPRAPTHFELHAARTRRADVIHHQSWMDYLYWDAALSQE